MTIERQHAFSILTIFASLVERKSPLRCMSFAVTLLSELWCKEMTLASGGNEKRRSFKCATQWRLIHLYQGVDITREFSALWQYMDMFGEK